MRRRRPAPAVDKGSSVVPLSRAHLVRADADDTDSAVESRDGIRSRFPALTPATAVPGTTVPPRGGAARAPARARRANAAPEPHDGWTFVLIPPGAGARPRTLRVSVRRLRFALASFVVLLGTTAATGALLVFAVSFIPPAQDEARGVELGLFASATSDSALDSARSDSSTPAGIAAASAGAAAPRTPPARPRVASRPPTRALDDGVSSSIMESLPVVGEITSRFARARRHPLLGVVRRHDGIDIAAPAGTQITAPAAGRVIFAGRKFGYGNTIDLDHGNGVVTRYGHCRTLMVREGDEVAAGAVIATVGRTGLATGPHLHYELRLNGRQVNPLRTPIASLINPKQAPAATPTPSPAYADSATRPAPVHDAPPRDVPHSLPHTGGDTVASAVALPALARTSLTVNSTPTVLPSIPAVAAPDTAKKS